MIITQRLFTTQRSLTTNRTRMMTMMRTRRVAVVVLLNRIRMRRKSMKGRISSMKKRLMITTLRKMRILPVMMTVVTEKPSGVFSERLTIIIRGT